MLSNYRKELNFIVEIVEYGGKMMKIAVRYYTRSGNTKKLALAIAEAVGVKAEDVSVPVSEKVDILFLGNSFYGFDVDDAVKAFVKDNKENIGKIVNFSTSALLKSTHKLVKKLAEENGIEIAAEEYHCRGSFGPMHKGRPNDKDLSAAKEFAKKILG